MKTITKLLSIAAIAFTLTACDEGLTERERECMELTKDAQHCIHRANRYDIDRYERERMMNDRMDRYNEPVYQGSQPMMNDQQFYQQNPSMNYDSGFSSGEMLLAAAGGALLSGYAVHKMKDGKYGYKDKSGKTISHSEYSKRVMQSDNSKLKNKLRENNRKHKAEVAKLKANKTKQSLKDKQLARKNAGVTSKDKAKSRFGEMNKVEQKAKQDKKVVQQKSKNDALKQRLQQKRKAQGKPVRKTSNYKSSSYKRKTTRRKRG